MSKQYTSLVEMQEDACERFAKRRVFGTKLEGIYRWITYADFASLVNRFRAALAQLGVEAGDRVAVVSNNRVEWAVGAYATYSLGGHYVPMYEAQSPAERRYIIEDSNSKVALAATEAIYQELAGLIGEVDSLEHAICFDAPESAPHSYLHHLAVGAENPVSSVHPSPDDLAGLLYTSGTTGKPKGVMLSHNNICSNLRVMPDLFPLSHEDVTCSFLPWAHAFGQTAELHGIISAGASMGLAESVQTLMENFLEVRPTVLLAVPRIFHRIYDGVKKRMADEPKLRQKLFEHALSVSQKRTEMRDHGGSSTLLDIQHKLFERVVFAKIKERFGGRLRFVMSGGAALAVEVAEFIDNLGITVFEGYGLTETSPVATVNRPGARRIGTVGQAIPDVSIYICDEQGKLLPPETDGEVLISGPNIMQGYHGLPEATAEVMVEVDGKQAFRTGDMGRLSQDGFLSITGRFKEQYKLENGKYVVPTLLEDQLKLSGFITQAFIYGDNKPFNVCLIVPDFEAIQKWAKSDEGGGVSGDLSPEALCADARVHAKIGEELAAYGAEFKHFEQPKRWKLLVEDFSPENGLMTPKMSVRRRAVTARYQDELDKLYID